jgi:zinc D-Ala-D-Ala carboxypeptidase
MNELLLRCHCCGEMKFTPEFVAQLTEFFAACRNVLGYEPGVTSGYRCPKHNAEVSEEHSLTGPHTIAAVDVACYGGAAMKILRLALARVPDVFLGIGIKQNGPYSGRFIHLDAAPNITGVRPRPWIWTY